MRYICKFKSPTDKDFWTTKEFDSLHALKDLLETIFEKTEIIELDTRIVKHEETRRIKENGR